MTNRPRWRSPGRASLDWAGRSLGRGHRVRSARTIRRGAGWHTNHVLELETPRGRVVRVVLRRWARPGMLEMDPGCTAEREAATLGRLEPTPVPAPRVLAADPDAIHCDVPALLLELLPGSPPPPSAPVEPAAELLAEIHEVDPTGLPTFRRYHEVPANPPHWLPRSATWDRVYEAAAGPLLPRPRAFVHRDFHLGNTLWSNGRITGIVDWNQASAAPPSADLGHMRWNLASARGPRVADRFEDAYRRITGRDHDPRWDLVSLVDVLPELEGLGARRLDRLTRYANGLLARL